MEVPRQVGAIRLVLYSISVSIALSVIVPVFNEAENLALLLPELTQELEALGGSFEMIIVDDCSTDCTLDVIRSFVSKDRRVRGFRLSMNTKKSGALATGFREARGEILITIDGDMQDIPKNIPLLLREISSGADIAVGWKCRRQDPWLKKKTSQVFNRACRLLQNVDLHDINSGLKAYKQSVIADLPLYGSLYRYGLLFLHAKNWRIREVGVSHRRRAFGRSKYGFLHRCRGISDFFIVASILRPSFSSVFRLSQRIIMVNAFLAIFLSIAGMTFARTGHLLSAMMLFLLAGGVGFVTVSLGVIGMMVGWILRRHVEEKPFPAYSEITVVNAA